MHVSSGAVLALTSRAEVVKVLHEAARIVECWVEDRLKFTPMLALHYVRPEFYHVNSEANMGKDWELLLQSAAIIAAYLAWMEVYEASTLLEEGVPQHQYAFLMLASIVESPNEPFGM